MVEYSTIIATNYFVIVEYSIFVGGHAKLFMFFPWLYNVFVCFFSAGASCATVYHAMPHCFCVFMIRFHSLRWPYDIRVKCDFAFVLATKQLVYRNNARKQ